MDELYPTGPTQVPAELVKPTSKYKRHASLAMASLAAFIALYLFLAGWFVWTAWRLISESMAGNANGFIGLLIGGCAAFLAIFMLKALFFVQKGGTSGYLEVTKKDQPRLFAFLARLADEAGAPRPHRVFLSGRVNAAVFYDLSIINLIWPSRKNLEIGLALVNVLTLSEMKAVLAHEFGHFAQRSMAIGGWVYIAQQIASQIIARRDALDKLLRMLSNFDLRVAWVGWILSLIVWSIRSLMDSLLRLVIIAQRALSRQMEFQADLVAVSLTGSDELIHALHKLQAADDAWDRTLNFAGSRMQRDKAPADLFAVQTRILDELSRILDDTAYGKTPATAVGPAHRVFKTSFAQPPQMWATHPANADREANAKQTYLPAPHDPRSAWELFSDADGLKSEMARTMYGENATALAAHDETVTALTERYALIQFQNRYRGAYLGRELTRHTDSPETLYEANPPAVEVQRALSALYPQGLSQDLQELRELEEERATLQALHDKVYTATGALTYRGRVISRRDLPCSIREVTAEADAVRQKIIIHDKRCRTAHLAAAAQLGNGWEAYLRGMIATLHYAEHSLADLRDAQGLLSNVVSIVTADGKVSGKELKRLISTGTALHAVMYRIDTQKTQLSLDSSICQRLEVASWAEMLEEFKLAPPDKDNINSWMNVIDGWVDAMAGALGALSTQTLEQLLQSEDKVASHAGAAGAAPIEDAPAPSVVPPSYAVLLRGKERPRQKKLGWWDRFQTADGTVASLARVAIAIAIVGGVLGFSSSVGTAFDLSVYNGLAQTVIVNTGATRVQVLPYSAAHVEVTPGEQFEIVTTTASGSEIERFSPKLGQLALHYVYNVAGASPLVEWTANYGNAAERPPHVLGAPIWTTSSADVFFADAPASVSTKSGGATRLIIDGAGEMEPEKVLNALSSDADRKQVVQAHLRWDPATSKHAAQWKALAPMAGPYAP